MAKEALIKAFLEGQCSEEELQELRAWLLKPENQEAAEALFAESWKRAPNEQSPVRFDSEAVLARIKDEITIPVEKEEQSSAAPSIGYRPKRRSYGGLIAGITLLAVLLLGYLIVPKDATEEAPPLTEVVREAPRGYRNTITLADGSVAILNSESSIRYAKDFGTNDRIVYLEGEAFFQVARNEAKPFVVISNGLKTTALGTSFNVNAYKKDQQAISLATGKVKVELIDSESGQQRLSPMTLIPGEQALWHPNTERLIKQPFDFDLILSWKDNTIHFDNTDLKSMIEVLEKWYDVEFKIIGETSKMTHTGTGTFANESLENVLDALGYSMGFSYQMRNNLITLNLTKD